MFWVRKSSLESFEWTPQSATNSTYVNDVFWKWVSKPKGTKTETTAEAMVKNSHLLNHNIVEPERIWKAHIL